MARMRSATSLRAILLVALAFGLQSSTCHAKFCSGDGCEDDEREHDGDPDSRVLVVLPPWGMPPNGPLAIVIRRLP